MVTNSYSLAYLAIEKYFFWSNFQVIPKSTKVEPSASVMSLSGPGPTYSLVCTPPGSKGSNEWTDVEKGGWNAMVQFDLAAYYFYVENYADCRKCLSLVKNTVDPKVAKEYLSYPVLEGYYTALLTGQEVQQETDR